MSWSRLIHWAVSTVPIFACSPRAVAGSSSAAAAARAAYHVAPPRSGATGGPALSPPIHQSNSGNRSGEAASAGHRPGTRRVPWTVAVRPPGLSSSASTSPSAHYAGRRLGEDDAVKRFPRGCAFCSVMSWSRWSPAPLMTTPPPRHGPHGSHQGADGVGAAAVVGKSEVAPR